MNVKGDCISARFKERPNRFLAKIQLNTDELIRAHVPDPGRLEELLIPNTEVLLQRKSNNERKTQFTVVAVRTDNLWVNIDSLLSNNLFQEDFEIIKGLIPYFKGFNIIRSEFPFGKSRFDFLIANDEKNLKALVEIKSVTLVKNGRALFPDAPTVRGVKHLNELIKAQNGYKSIIVFIIKRSDATSFSPNGGIDPQFSKTLLTAIQSGVRVFAVKCAYDPIIKKEIKILDQVPLILFD